VQPEPAEFDAAEPQKYRRRSAPADGFSQWLWKQVGRDDTVGQLAHVVTRDPNWRGGSRPQVLDYMRNMGANEATRHFMGQAYAEYEVAARAERIKTQRRNKNKAARQARKKARR
jgi:hypothetical protein